MDTLPQEPIITTLPEADKPVKLVNTSRIAAFLQWYKSLPAGQKVSAAALAFIALVIPVSLAATYQEVRDRSKAYTPISVPLPTATPQPTSIPLPTPTPKPGPNLPPVISTTSLPKGSVGQPYQGTVAASDPNPTDNLNLTLTGLPEPLKSVCAKALNQPNRIACTINGTPLKTGNYTVTATANDGRGGIVKKTFKFQISKTNKITPLPTPSQ